MIKTASAVSENVGGVVNPLREDLLNFAAVIFFRASSSFGDAAILWHAIFARWLQVMQFRPPSTASAVQSQTGFHFLISDHYYPHHCPNNSGVMAVMAFSN